MALPERWTTRGRILRWTNRQKSGTRFTAKMILEKVLLREVTQRTVTRHLSKLAEEGFVRRSKVMRGRNSYWIVE